MKIGYVEIDDDFFWIDEYENPYVQENLRYTLDGKPIINLWKRKGKIPMTLGRYDGTPIWVKKKVLDDLYQLMNYGEPFQVILNDGRSFLCLFNYSSKPVIETEPIEDKTPLTENSLFALYRVKLQIIS